MKRVRIKDYKLNESGRYDRFNILIDCRDQEGNVLKSHRMQQEYAIYHGSIDDARRELHDVVVGKTNRISKQIHDTLCHVQEVNAPMVVGFNLTLCDKDMNPIDKPVFVNTNKFQSVRESYSGRHRNWRKINEARVSVRGTRKDADIYPVPYDDDYVERYGSDNPRDEHRSENQFIEKYADAIAQRLEYIFKQYGVNVAVEVSEDIENAYYHEINKEFNNRMLRFRMRITSLRNKRYGATKTLQCATVASKMFSHLSVVNRYDIQVECDDYGKVADITINAYVKPDKNGMIQLEKELK